MYGRGVYEQTVVFHLFHTVYGNNPSEVQGKKKNKWAKLIVHGAHSFFNISIIIYVLTH